MTRILICTLISKHILLTSGRYTDNYCLWNALLSVCIDSSHLNIVVSIEHHITAISCNGVCSATFFFKIAHHLRNYDSVLLDKDPTSSSKEGDIPLYHGGRSVILMSGMVEISRWRGRGCRTCSIHFCKIEYLGSVHDIFMLLTIYRGNSLKREAFTTNISHIQIRR